MVGMDKNHNGPTIWLIFKVDPTLNICVNNLHLNFVLDGPCDCDSSESALGAPYNIFNFGCFLGVAYTKMADWALPNRKW